MLTVWGRYVGLMKESNCGTHIVCGGRHGVNIHMFMFVRRQRFDSLYMQF